MTTCEITTLRWVPPFAVGYVRDLRPRWALEEAGVHYTIRLIDGGPGITAEYRKRQPFAQVPVFRDDTTELFESGAILLHLADCHPALAPTGRAKAAQWVLAALNSVELRTVPLLNHENSGSNDTERRTTLKAALDSRLSDLSDWLWGRDYLEGAFSVGDIAMATALRELETGGHMDAHPVVAKYVQRCLDRPAFKKALGDQIALYDSSAKTRAG